MPMKRLLQQPQLPHNLPVLVVRDAPAVKDVQAVLAVKLNRAGLFLTLQLLDLPYEF